MQEAILLCYTSFSFFLLWWWNGEKCKRCEWARQREQWIRPKYTEILRDLAINLVPSECFNRFAVVRWLHTRSKFRASFVAGLVWYLWCRFASKANTEPWIFSIAIRYSYNRLLSSPPFGFTIEIRAIRLLYGWVWRC